MTKPSLEPSSVVLRRYHENRHASWNRSPSSQVTSVDPDDASTRIFDRYAAVVPQPPPNRCRLTDPVFAMGSCFARELEYALRKQGGNVISVDDAAINDPAFFDAKKQAFRNGFFHRFTPRAMLQEFQRCFGELPGWTDDSLLFQDGARDRYSDCHYWPIAELDPSLQASQRRRAIAKGLVRRVVDARLVVLTLGLTESWTHLASGIALNRADPKLLVRRPSDFAFHRLGHDEVVDCLTGIRDLVVRHHSGGVHFVVTVSPVPLEATFSGDDIVTANMDSKSTLRSAARAFVDRHKDASYFPSYEMVLYSAHAEAWRPDRLHVRPGMVEHVVSTFARTYFG